jgi:hypothetical protein
MKRQDKQDKTRQDKTRQGKTQDKTRQDKTRQDKTGQDKAQSRTRQDKTTQGRTSHDTTTHLCAKGWIFCPIKTLYLHNIKVQKHNFFVPRQKIDVHEQVLMKCKYVLLAFSSKTTLRPSKLVFTQEFRVEGNISVFVSKQIYCVGKNTNLPLEQVSLDMR